MAEIKEKLFDQFPPITTEQWREKVDADLKGAPFEKNWFGVQTKDLT